MILKQLILVLLVVFLVMGCVGAVSADDSETSSDGVNETLVSAETTQTPILPTIDSFSKNVSSGSAPLAVSFTFSGTNVDSYSLNFGDGNTDSSPSNGVEHVYTAVGEYTANLTATNTNGTVYKTTTISVTSPLAASFTMSPTSGTAPLFVQFTDTSTGSPNAWAWDFGDGNYSLNQNPTCTFSNAGTYTVSLTVSKPGAESSTTSHTITVAPAQTLTNITSLSVTQLTPPAFGATPDISASVSGGGTLVDVSWNHGTSPFGENTHYTATVTIKNATGYTFSTKPTVFLNDALVSPVYVTLDTATQRLTFTHTFPKTESKILPTIALSANVTTGTVSLPVKFTYTVTNATLTSPMSWTYGDGYSLSSLPSYSGTLTHTYTTVGNYTANLTATNANGTVYKTVVITVKKVGLDAAFTASASSGTAPLTVLFVDTSAGSPTQWVWDFGGLGSSATKNPSYTFTTPGTYIVKLTVIDSNGATDSYSRAIYVNAPAATSTPTVTQTATPTPASSFIGELSIPAPLDIVKEFMRLFYSLFDSTNYVILVNES